MGKAAFGFEYSQLINKSIPGNFLVLSKNTRLYYPKNYVDLDRFKKCIINYSSLSKNNSKEECLNKHKINQIVINQKNEIIDEKLFNCENINSFRPDRKFIFKKNYSYKYCIKKDLYK